MCKPDSLDCTVSNELSPVAWTPCNSRATDIMQVAQSVHVSLIKLRLLLPRDRILDLLSSQTSFLPCNSQSHKKNIVLSPRYIISGYMENRLFADASAFWLCSKQSRIGCRFCTSFVLHARKVMTFGIQRMIFNLFCSFPLAYYSLTPSTPTRVITKIEYTHYLSILPSTK